MFKDSLQIFIITYNRAERLEQTLAQFLEGPFSGCDIFILDNNSTDATSKVILQFAQAHANITSIRHSINIGFCANFLRCFELASKRYMWIVGDDDNWNFDSACEIASALESGTKDVIVIGGPGIDDGFYGREARLGDLIGEGFKAFHIMGFISAKIFSRRSVVPDFCMQAYRSGYFGYIENRLIEGWVEANVEVKIVSKSLVERNHETVFASYLVWLNSWVGGIDAIRAKKWRRIALLDPFNGQFGFTKAFALGVLHGLVKRNERFSLYVSSILCRIGIPLCFLCILLLPINIPIILWGAFRNLRKKRGRKAAELFE